MIAWSIEAARNAAVFDEVMVSTDDSEIAEVARAHGAKVPFLRSAENADDFATMAAVLTEVLDRYADRGETVELACCIYATAPFIRSADLTEGLEQMHSEGWSAVLPVARFDYPIWRSLSRSPDGKVLLNYPEHVNARSQDLQPAYHDAGQWVWFRPEHLRRDGTVLGPNTGSLVLPATHVQDVDTEEDWLLAELKHARLFP